MATENSRVTALLNRKYTNGALLLFMLLLAGCITRPALTAASARDCIVLTLSYRQMTRGVEPARLHLLQDPAESDFLAFELFEQTPRGPRRLGQFRVMPDRWVFVYDNATDAWQAAAICD